MSLKLYRLRCEVLNMLEELSLEQIAKVENEFTKKYPQEYPMYNDLFAIAANRKRRELRMNDIIVLIEQYNNTPSDATNI